jgi:two-component system response regulator
MFGQEHIQFNLIAPSVPPGGSYDRRLTRKTGSREPQNERMRVLLVEDDPDHAELIRRGFQSHSLETELQVVSDGQEALDFLFGQGEYAIDSPDLPHLILLDLKLPKVSGLEVLKTIKRSDRHSHIPVVILTTSEDRRDISRAYEYHANSFLVKPSDTAEFNQLMQDLRLYWLDHNYLL